jgi:hypothetical protein
MTLVVFYGMQISRCSKQSMKHPQKNHNYVNFPYFTMDAPYITIAKELKDGDDELAKVPINR